MAKVQISFVTDEGRENDIRGFLRVAGVESITVKLLPAKEAVRTESMPPPHASNISTAVVGSGIGTSEGERMRRQKVTEEQKLKTILLSPGTVALLRFLQMKKIGTEAELGKVFRNEKTRKGGTYAGSTFFTYLHGLKMNGFVRQLPSGSYELNQEKMEELKKFVGSHA